MADAGLIVLEGSHKKVEQLRAYWSQDVDSYCENGPNAEKVTRDANACKRPFQILNPSPSGRR